MTQNGDDHVGDSDGEHPDLNLPRFGLKGALLGAFFGACVTAMALPKSTPKSLTMQALNIMKNTARLFGRSWVAYTKTMVTIGVVSGVVSGVVAGVTSAYKERSQLPRR